MDYYLRISQVPNMYRKEDFSDTIYSPGNMPPPGVVGYPCPSDLLWGDIPIDPETGKPFGAGKYVEVGTGTCPPGSFCPKWDWNTFTDNMSVNWIMDSDTAITESCWKKNSEYTEVTPAPFSCQDSIGDPNEYCQGINPYESSPGKLVPLCPNAKCSGTSCECGPGCSLHPSSGRCRPNDSLGGIPGLEKTETPSTGEPSTGEPAIGGEDWWGSNKCALSDPMNSLSGAVVRACYKSRMTELGETIIENCPPEECNITNYSLIGEKLTVQGTQLPLFQTISQEQTPPPDISPAPTTVSPTPTPARSITDEELSFDNSKFLTGLTGFFIFLVISTFWILQKQKGDTGTKNNFGG